jgi:hypothetical protein
MMQTTFLLVDLENVQPHDLSALEAGSFHVKVFVGAHQSKVPVSLASALQNLGPNAEYIRIDGSGHNALDFHIAYYLGRLAAEHPQARFRILSKDTGFDPLVSHLKARKVHCERLPSLAQPQPVSVPAEPGPDKFPLVIANLAKRKAGRPRTLKSLGGSIQALFHKQLSEDELRALLDALSERGVVKVVDGKLTYHLPKEP